MELLIDQLVLGNIMDDFSKSLLSITQDVMIIKTESPKLFDDCGREIEELDQAIWTSTKKLRDIKMSCCIIISIRSALGHLQSWLRLTEDKYTKSIRKIHCLMNKLRCVRTFVFCSRKMGTDLELRTVLVRLDDVVCRILDYDSGVYPDSDILSGSLENLETFDETIHKWYISLSECNSQQTPFPVVSQVLDNIVGSVLENFEDFLVSFRQPRRNPEYLEEPVKSLKEYITFLRNFIHFSNLVYGDQHQIVQDLVTQMEPLVVTMAHLTGLYGTTGIHSEKRIKSICSALQSKIKPSHNPTLYEAYSQTLASLKHEIQATALRANDDPLTITMSFLVSLLSLLWDMQRENVDYFAPLYEGLRSLRTLFRNYPEKHHGEIRDFTRVLLCDAGIMIFSLHQRDFDADRGLQEFREKVIVIRSKVDDRKLNFPEMAVLDFLDSLLYYLAEVKCSVDDSDAWNCIPTIRDDLVFLKSLMGRLIQLMNEQEADVSVCQALWNRARDVAYKLEFLIDQLVLGNILDSFPASVQSVAEDMMIIKTDSIKVFNGRGQEIKVQQLAISTSTAKVRDIKMASSIMTSILSAMDYLQSRVDRNDFIGHDSKEWVMFLMSKLRSLRTFVLCSTKFGNSVELRALLGRLDGVVCRILNRAFSCHSAYDDCQRFWVDMEPFRDEMDEWYNCLAALPGASPVVEDIVGSVLENYEDFVLCYDESNDFVGYLVRPIKSLRENIAFVRNFICFAALICADQYQVVQDVFTQIEALAISMAQLTVYLFESENGRSYDRMESIISVLQVKVRPFMNPHLYAPALHTNDDPLSPMMDVIVSLLSLLWDMLQSDIDPKNQFEMLYSGLRSLRTLLRKQPSRFLDERMRDLTRVAICDAGVIISSIDRKDVVIDRVLKKFLEGIELIGREVEDRVGTTSKLNFPMTSTLVGFLEFLLDYLTEVKDDGGESCVPKVREYLIFLRSFMRILGELRHQKENSHEVLWNLAVEVSYKIELLIDQLVLGHIPGSFSTSFQSIKEDMKIFYEWRQDISTDQVPSARSDDLVSFETERLSIIDRLRRGSKKLQVVAIVGMPGLGKTTLATKVYKDVSVVDHFLVCAWCSISQVFNKKKVLLELLNHIQPDQNGANSTKDEYELSEKLRRSLKGRKYLIFLDDIWDIKVFNSLKGSLPDDNYQSRILLTSRHDDVFPKDLLDGEPVCLPRLNVNESLELLKRKSFPAQKNWPPEILHEFRMKIAENCKGLPLTIVVVGGLLQTTEKEVWRNVMESLSSGIGTHTDQCESTIELSYKYLPDRLKPCFLSFAAFPEDHEISVKRLILLWIAEGFVRKSETKSSEEVAEDYLGNLIGRSLVMVAKERSKGGVKACRIHDSLRDFCLKKANEDLFLHQLKGYEEMLCFDEPGNMRRLSIHSTVEHFKDSRLLCPRLRSLFFFNTAGKHEKIDLSFIFRVFKLLRVMDVEKIIWSEFPSDIGFLVQLRYLVIQATGHVSPSIGNLSNLVTFILYEASERRVILPDTFWDLKKLRHMYFIYTRNKEFSTIELPVDNLESSGNLLELNSLSTLGSENWSIMEKHLNKFPNLNQLKFMFSRFGGDILNGSNIMSLSFLRKLESLSLTFGRSSSTEFEFVFPESIKKLSLCGFQFPWSKISSIAKLPNLVVLKLLWGSFVGDTWNVEEGEFAELKFLKLRSLDIVNWTADLDDQFLNLEKLVLERCRVLKEIPECLQNAPVLTMIEVLDCSEDAVSLIKQVAEYQKEMGNIVPQVLVRRSAW